MVLRRGDLTRAPLESAASSLAGGGALFVALARLQPRAVSCARERPSRAWWLADAAYSYAGLWCSVLVWRGVWQLWDHALGIGLAPAPPSAELARGGWLSHGAGVAGCLVTDNLRSLNAAPMLLAADATPPLFGAKAGPGVHELTWLRRLAKIPGVPSEPQREWPPDS